MQRSGTRAENHRLGPDDNEFAGLNVEQDRAHDPLTTFVHQQFQAARVFQAADVAGKNLVAQTRHDFDAGQVADVDQLRSKLWPANGFWWMRPSGARSKRQPILFSSSRTMRGASSASVQARS